MWVNETEVTTHLQISNKFNEWDQLFVYNTRYTRLLLFLCYFIIYVNLKD